MQVRRRQAWNTNQNGIVRTNQHVAVLEPVGTDRPWFVQTVARNGCAVDYRGQVAESHA